MASSSEGFFKYNNYDRRYDTDWQENIWLSLSTQELLPLAASFLLPPARSEPTLGGGQVPPRGAPTGGRQARFSCPFLDPFFGRFFPLILGLLKKQLTICSVFFLILPFAIPTHFLWASLKPWVQEILSDFYHKLISWWLDGSACDRIVRIFVP